MKKKSIILSLVCLLISSLPTVLNASDVAQDIGSADVELNDSISSDLYLMRPYDFFFRYLPIVVAEVKSADIVDYTYSNPRIVTDVLPLKLGMKSPFSADQIKASKLRSEVGDVYIWEFPTPTEVPLCKYVAFVPTKDGFKMITLEKSFENIWVIGTQDSSAHSSFNYIDYMPESPEKFLKVIPLKKIVKD